MPGQRYQDPKIQTRADVKRPFYFIRPYVPKVTSEGIRRKKQSLPIGFCTKSPCARRKPTSSRSWRRLTPASS